MKTDIVIVGSGCSGLYAALHLDRSKNILLISKSDFESSDSFLAQGGMCMLRDENDFEDYFEDTMKAGHYENDKKSVEIMIKSSPEVVEDLLSYGVDFHRTQDGSLDFTKEGGHGKKRILFHEDITGKEITRNLLKEVKKLPNVTMMDYTTMVDIIQKNGKCIGIIAKMKDGSVQNIFADYTIWATGGIGGCYRHSTNFRHLTGDALAIALRHGIEVKDIDYVQIHPTTFYSEKEEDRSFLISESVRGEGAKLYNKDMERFVNELLPRDLLTAEIYKQMQSDNTLHVWEDLRTIPADEVESHFPNIVGHCREMGYDVTKECIPVVPAQHYFMGGVKVNHQSHTSMDRLYAVGETACNGVHGKNRLASNSLLESLVFAKRAAKEINETYEPLEEVINQADYVIDYDVDLKRFMAENKMLIMKEISERKAERNV